MKANDVTILLFDAKIGMKMSLQEPSFTLIYDSTRVVTPIFRSLFPLYQREKKALKVVLKRIVEANGLRMTPAFTFSVSSTCAPRLRGSHERK